MKVYQLNPNTKIQDIEAIPQSNGFLYRGTMYVKTQIDEFASAEETRTVVWLWKGENKGQEDALNMWQDTVVRDASMGCISFKTHGPILVTVFYPGDGLLQPEELTEEEQTEFASAVSYACLQLCEAGLEYTRWSSSCVARQGVTWKVLPTGDLKITKSPDRAAAMAALGEWFRTLNLPLFYKEPARSIIKMMCQKKIPDEMYDEMGCQAFWQKLENVRPPLRVNVQTTDTKITLSWEPDEGKVSFRALGPKETPPRGTLILGSESQKIGQDFAEHPSFRPRFDDSRCSMSWDIPTSNKRYEIVRLLPLVENREWFQPGIPFRAGGPPDIQIFNAWFDSETMECVIAFNWVIDPNVKSVRIVFRTDRYAESPTDYDGISPANWDRAVINHPFRKRIPFQSEVYVTVFTVVELDGRRYFSPGQSRAIISRHEEPGNGSPEKSYF